jgi:hypothetical protein
MPKGLTVRNPIFPPQFEGVHECNFFSHSVERLRVLDPPTWDVYSKYRLTDLESGIHPLILNWVKYSLRFEICQRGFDFGLKDYLVALRWIHRGLRPTLAVKKCYLCRIKCEKFRELNSFKKHMEPIQLDG